MEITYFFVFIAVMLACLLFFICKTTSGSYLHGNKDDALDLKELRAAYQRNEIEHPAVDAYVDRYLRKLEDVRCEKDRRQRLGIAYMANESINDVDSSPSQFTWCAVDRIRL